jgi:hypothetical protein
MEEERKFNDFTLLKLEINGRMKTTSLGGILLERHWRGTSRGRRIARRRNAGGTSRGAGR